MRKLDGRVALIRGQRWHWTRGNQGLIEAGAYVVVTGRRQTELDRAKQLLGKNATAVLGFADECD